jgi:hypothetical protein
MFEVGNNFSMDVIMVDKSNVIQMYYIFELFFFDNSPALHINNGGKCPVLI